MFNIKNLSFVTPDIRDKVKISKFVDEMRNEYENNKAWGVPMGKFVIPGGCDIENYIDTAFEDWFVYWKNKDKFVKIVEDNTQNNAVIGIISMNLDPIDNESDIELSVLFDYRRLGIGSCMFDYGVNSILTYAEMKCKERKINIFCQDVDLQSKSFVESQNGMKCIDRIKNKERDIFKYIFDLNNIEDIEDSQKYKYISVRQKMNWNVISKNYFDIIQEYARKGWRFVCIVPVMQRSDGLLSEFDLVFEKED